MISSPRSGNEYTVLGRELEMNRSVCVQTDNYVIPPPGTEYMALTDYRQLRNLYYKMIM